jgi:hypothetical protein
MLNRSIFTSFLIFSLSISSQLGAENISGLYIMQRMEDTQRATNDASFTRLKLSSCRFGIKNKRIGCAEKPRVKVLESVSINYGVDNKDTKNVSITVKPASEKGVGMLTYSYDKAGKDNQTWLYLSALGRVKRVAGGNSDEDTEPASLFGSEFTTEDTDTGKLSEYSIKLVGEAVTSGREAWKIEAVPIGNRFKKSRYSRTLHFIDKERYVALRSEMYDRYGKEVKRSIASRIELINNNWVARSITMMNLVSNRLSNMALVEIYTDLNIDDEFLTQRTLTDTAYREAKLSQLRTQLD